MLKTSLVFIGVLVVSASGLQAQGPRSFAGRDSFASARSSAYRGYGHGGYGNHGYRGRFYYLGGVPYFYPFGFGFGYPYYGGYYGDGAGYGYGYGDGYGGYPNGNNGAYNGTIADGNGQASGGQQSGGSLPEAVQGQLAKRGYYKGTVDGKFGPESRSALQRFQRKQGLKETGNIDEPTLEALGFTDRH